MIELFDSHCHLDVEEFDADRAPAIDRARAAGVAAQLIPAIDRASWPRIRDLCSMHPGLHPAYGLHPMFIANHASDDIGALRDWLGAERPAAVGECGLDYFVDGLDRETQRELFQQQLRLAREFDLPVVIHARKAVDEVIQRIRAIGGLRGVVHSYSGSPEQAQQLWRLGFLIGLGGPVTYPRAQRLRRLVGTMPLEFLLLESDAPDQPDADWRGHRNDPARLLRIAECVAELRDSDPGTIARVTRDNALRLFGLQQAA